MLLLQQQLLHFDATCTLMPHAQCCFFKLPPCHLPVLVLLPLHFPVVFSGLMLADVLQSVNVM